MPKHKFILNFVTAIHTNQMTLIRTFDSDNNRKEGVLIIMEMVRCIYSLTENICQKEHSLTTVMHNAHQSTFLGI